MNNIQFKGVPTFRILDYQKALKFYVDFLGFTIDWEHRFGPSDPVYMQIAKNGLTLHLSENKRFQTGVILFVDTLQIRKFRKELTVRNGTGTAPEIAKTDWGTLQMEIEDPFGNLFRFNETITQ